MLKTCACFTGHRRLSALQKEKLSEKLDMLLSRLVAEGMLDFYAGGALGFDMLAEEAVLRQREHNPDVHLHLVLPCLNQTEKWSAAEKKRYQRLLEEADDVEYVSLTYTTEAVFERNRRLVDYTTHCIAFRTHAGGGTDYTVRYAEKQTKTILLMEV